MQSVRDFPQTKLDSEINSLFLLNELGDPQIFFQVFVKNSQIKNIFEEDKNFDSRTWFFLEKSPLLDVFWPRPGLQANHRTARKSAIFPQPSNQKQLKWSNTAHVNKWRFTFKIKVTTWDLTLYEGDLIFNAQPVKIPPIYEPADV